ncbi:hypothetical protein DVH24_036549 [Malus domestica]|uniref:Uncharacterized protein n=1 Tax=Malus domestica TaxID=3750 RepID=A0A498IF58_MALDO|nr:hypothetical protein DVH24_036549 [Malus domestica]
MASAIHFPLALKSGGFPLEASDYSTIFGLPWTSLHFKSISNFYLDWVSVDFRVGMGKDTRVLIFLLPYSFACVLPLRIENSKQRGGRNRAGVPGNDISSIGCWTKPFCSPELVEDNC